MRSRHTLNLDFHFTTFAQSAPFTVGNNITYSKRRVVFKHVGDVVNSDSGRQVDALISHTGFKYFTSIPDACRLELAVRRLIVPRQCAHLY